MQLPHIISAKDFTRPQLDALFARAEEVKDYLAKNYRWTDEGHIANPLPPKLAGRTMELFFDQPSLRTKSSFEAAMEALGGNCGVFSNASIESSLAKGESLEDTFEMLSGNPTVSVMVVRHPQVDAAKIAASVSSVPVINAGDGTEHPTQALVDLFTIQEALGSVDGKRICFVGDMHARTARSLLYALTLYSGMRVCLSFPPELKPEEQVKQYLIDNNLNFKEDKGGWPEGVVPFLNVLYVLRPQQENWRKDMRDPTERSRKISGDLKQYYRLYTVNKRILSLMPENSIVLHPRPRGPELPTEVDSDPRVLHVRQGRNGGPVRIALLEMMHSGEWQRLANK